MVGFIIVLHKTADLFFVRFSTARNHWGKKFQPCKSLLPSSSTFHPNDIDAKRWCMEWVEKGTDTGSSPLLATTTLPGRARRKPGAIQLSNKLPPLPPGFTLSPLATTCNSVSAFSLLTTTGFRVSSSRLLS
ncbi:hypothetical protein BaRGS_00030556 [Batillaria attramentaria]|uniref:Uncharacterized protein n=1 Tax=Batillaria attramentaria TaxID=370345 RepID=A0ABD0JU71_9CAEN